MALGWSLAQAGWEVTMVDVNQRKLAAGLREGLSVNGVRQSRVAFEDFAAWTPPENAAVLLCTKTYDNAAVLARLPDRRLLVPVQNGFEPMLDASDHPCEGIASFVSECEPNRPATRITRRGGLYLGGRRPLSGEERRALAALAAGLKPGGWKHVRLVDRISPYKSAKLMYNAAISPLAAAAGVDNAALLGDPLARPLFFALLRENYAILRGRRIPLARIGPLPPWLVNWILGVPCLPRLLAHCFQPGLRGTHCSMLHDLGAGRSEIAAYNGHLKWLAQGRACPINTAVLDMIGALQEKRLAPGRERLAALADALGMGGTP